MPQSRILIIEDDAMMADTISSMVELFGYQTLIFPDPLRALGALAEEQPDLILLDLNLPGGMNGVEFCRRVKADSAGSGIAVIIISAEDSPQIIQQAKQAGASRYLVKPIGLDDLETAIAETLSER